MSVLAKLIGEEEFVETLRSMAECPVCISVPRGGKFYLCQNSHSICENCYKRLGQQQQQQQEEAGTSSRPTAPRPGMGGRPFHHGSRTRNPPRQCPQCRGKFPAHPMKNRTLERLIDEVRFEFPCSFSKNGCKVKNVDDKLKVHERECKFRDVQCPKCRAVIPFVHVRQHIVDRHPDVPPCHVNRGGGGGGGGEDDNVTVCLESWLFGRAAFTLSGISVILSMTEYRGHTFCPSIYKVNDHWYIWIYVLASRRTAARFEAELGMEENGLRIAGPCPVVSVDDRLDEVLRREETLEMSNRLLAAVVDREGVTGVERRAGYCARFSVRFLIREAKIDLEF